jgi:hypothetical protein
MPNAPRCPTPDDLRRFQLGDLPEEAGEAVLRHLPTCPNCLAALEQSPARDAFTNALSSAEIRAIPTLEAAAVEKLLKRLRAGPASSGDARRGTEVHVAADNQFLAPPQQADEIGRLGPYRVLRLLGEGGMGLVYLAEDPALRRQVALKVVKPTAAPTARQRFLREARAMAAVKSDHVVVVHQVGEDRRVPTRQWSCWRANRSRPDCSARDDCRRTRCAASAGRRRWGWPRPTSAG